MKSVICRPFKWLGIKFRTPCVADRPEVRQKLEAWRYARTNDTDVIERDSQHDALLAAERLWRSDPESALATLSTLAEQGSVWSMLLAGWAYESGKGVSPDLAKAELWYRLAFEGGAQQALLRLGRIYWLRSDFARSEEVYAVGAADNWAPAMYYLAWVKLRQPKTPARLEAARVLLEQASAHGDLGAQWDLARLTSRGRFGWRRIPDALRIGLDACKKIDAAVDNNASPDGPEDSAVALAVRRTLAILRWPERSAQKQLP